MKKLLLTGCLLLCSLLLLNAQKQELPAIYQSEAALTEYYQLTETQQVALRKIIANRNQNLAAIESIRATQEQTFWNKRKAIYRGQQNSIERLLINKNQRTLFYAQKKNDRLAESKIIKRLLAEGHQREVARFLLLTERY